MKAHSIQTLLSEYHNLMDEIFILHQEAVISGDFPLAIKTLQRFASLLRQHINTENNGLFVMHQQQVSSEQHRWPASLYRHEHNKIEQLLADIEQSASCLNNDASRREIIALLEQELRFKNVIEHHEQREEIALLPELEKVLSADELKKLVDELSSQWPSFDQLQQECRQWQSLLNTSAD